MPVIRCYDFGPFRLDAHERVVRRDGQPLALTPKAFELLLVLVERHGQIVSREELLQAVWPDAFVEEGNINFNIFALRRALQTDATTYIETVPRRGYRFVANVQAVAEESPRSNRQSPISSLAVLPFTLLGPEASEDYLGLGIADALITRLANLPQIIVRPTSAVRQYAGQACDPVAIGRALKVEAVLEGSIRQAATQIRVTLQLVSVTRAAPLWAEKFDESFTDIFTLEDRISERIAEALALELTGAERARLTKRHTANTDAYRLYLQGRHHWNKRTAEGLRKGIECFQRALDDDPNYALAWAGLADCYVLLSYWGGVAPNDCFPKAKAAVLRALELDDGLAEAHASLALVKRNYEWDWAGAEQAFNRALALKPHYASTHHWRGDYLTTLGHLEEGLAALKQAHELDPLSPTINARIGMQLRFLRRYDEAIAHARLAADLDPHFYPTQTGLGLVLALAGKLGEARAELDHIRTTAPVPLVLGARGVVAALSGQRNEAQQVIAELQAMTTQLYVSPYFSALIYAGLKEHDLAFAWLEQAYRERTDWLLWLNVEPLLDALRVDPRFADLLRRVRLAQ